MKRITHLEGHRTEDLARVFNRVVNPTPINDLEIPRDANWETYLKALMAERRRAEWLLGLKIALVVVGATIAVLASIVIAAEVF